MVYHVLQGEEMPGMVKSSVPEVFSTAAAIVTVQGGKGGVWWGGFESGNAAEAA